MTNKGRSKLIKQNLEKLDKKDLDKIESMTNSLLAIQKEGEQLLKKNYKNIKCSCKNFKKEQITDNS